MRIDYGFEMLINKTTLPKRGLLDDRALRKANVFSKIILSRSSLQCLVKTENVLF